MQPDTSKQPAKSIGTRLRPAALILAVIAVIMVAVVSLAIANHRSAPTRQPAASDNPASAQDQPSGGQEKPSGPSASSAVNTEANQSSTIAIGDQGFSPSTLTIATNTPVTWKNDTSEDRAIDMADTAKPGPHSPRLKPGASFTYAFASPGTFSYVDVTRPTISGTVIVKDPGQ